MYPTNERSYLRTMSFLMRVFSALVYTSQPYLESMAMGTEVLYIPYATSSKEQNVNIITFTQFEEWNLISEYCKNLLFESCNDTESGEKSGDKYNDNSTLPSLISEGKMDEMSSDDESDAEPMSPDMLEDICDRSQSHCSINRIEARYKICYCIKQRIEGCKGELSSTQKMCKGSYTLFKAVVN